MTAPPSPALYTLPVGDSDDESPPAEGPDRALIPAGEAETVQALVQREIANYVANLKAERALSLRKEKRAILNRLRDINSELGESYHCKCCPTRQR